ncbi:MAG: iron ABC transporter permease [Thermoleophilia bacterium]|nr:iron ABC transporter permease [Thermoleophilia bacterium]
MTTAATRYADQRTVSVDTLHSRWIRCVVILAVFGLGALVFVVLNLSIGSVRVPFGDGFRVLFGGHVANEVHAQIVSDIRLPRTLGGLACGAALAVAGLLLQAFFRNPIVEPYVLGISSGSTMMVAFVVLGGLTLWSGFGSIAGVALASLLGALAVLFVVLLLSTKVRSVISLLVIGLMLGYACSAVTTLLQSFADKEQLHQFVMWTFGSFSGFTWQATRITCIAVAVLAVGAFLLSKPLNAFLLGENYARSMGVNTQVFRYVILTISGCLTGVVTAFAGPVAFIGLAAPHIARLSLGTSDNRVLIPGCVFLGALIAGLCDLAARMLFSPVELPISVPTAFFGAPIVIGLLLRGRSAP